MNLSKVNERILMKEAKLLKAEFFLDYLEIMDYQIWDVLFKFFSLTQLFYRKGKWGPEKFQLYIFYR